MRLVFLGLSLSSSWGNGHATTYRALLAALAARGHAITFLEREQPWYAAHRDLQQPDYCDLRFYDSLPTLRRFGGLLRDADAVIIGSYVPDGVAVIQAVLAALSRTPQRTAGNGDAEPLLCFYDIDTPVTLRKLADGDADYLSPGLVPAFDLYLSFTGGPVLRVVEQAYGARAARALYCSVDPALYRPSGADRRWELGYLGTYSADRQPALERLLLEPARRLPDRRFVVAGPLYPADIAWPDNVDRIEHLPPARHASFYGSLGWALNITRADMVRAGYSPSVRLFEATACGTPVITDEWPGLDSLFTPGSELLTAATTAGVQQALALPEERRRGIGLAGQRRTLQHHTAARRAQQLETYLRQVGATAARTVAQPAFGRTW